MVLYNELPVYRDTYNLLIEVYQVTNRFAHEYKYSLGQDMKRDALSLFRNLYRANKSTAKAEHLESFLNDFELLKLEMRLCVDLKLLPIKKMAQLSRIMDAVGRQVTAWRHKTNANAQGQNLSAGGQQSVRFFHKKGLPTETTFLLRGNGSGFTIDWSSTNNGNNNYYIVNMSNGNVNNNYNNNNNYVRPVLAFLCKNNNIFVIMPESVCLRSAERAVFFIKKGCRQK